MYYHKDFPWGKGLWIRDLDKCLEGNIDAIIQKCKEYNISYLLIKNGDGTKLWTQLTKEIVTALQNAQIKVFAWTYVSGTDPLAEAAVAVNCLDLGVDGFVFDAEGEYEHLENNAQTAQTMLEAVRAKHPDKFLAYTTFALIDWHEKFPYTTFGKYCDAVMPQIYHGTWGSNLQEAILNTYHNFIKWQDNWEKSGHADSVKPVIPIGQGYDDFKAKTPYVVLPADLDAFVKIVKGYKSVSFWSFQHLLREDCWIAIRDAQLESPTDAERGVAPVAETAPDAQVEEVVAQEEAPQVWTTLPEIPTEETLVATENKPQVVEVPNKINVPADGKTTITVKPDASQPNGVKVTVVTHKTHREYFVEFISYVVALFRRK